jgi:hypothetical protein
MRGGRRELVGKIIEVKPRVCKPCHAAISDAEPSGNDH